MSENNPPTSANTPPKLVWPEVVRLRPGMYFGSIGSAGLYELVSTVVNHAIDETLTCQNRQVKIVLKDPNIISVSNNGAGLPLERDPETNRPILELLMTGAKRIDIPDEKFCVSTFRGHLCFVNAGSAEFSVQIKRNGFLWQQQYKQGLPITDLERLDQLQESVESETTITFAPDFSIFEPNELDYKLLLRRCREIALLISGLTIEISDQRSGHETQTNRFVFTDGLRQYLGFLNQTYSTLHDPIIIRKTIELERDYEPLGYTADIEIALQFAQIHQPILLGFINALDIEQGGTHIRGFIEALDREISDFASEKQVGGFYTFIEDDLVCGLSAVINIWHPKPEFVGSARYELANPELRDAVYWLTREAIDNFSTEYPDQMQRILDKCFENKALRLHRRYREEEHK